ncbi:unnamed protein product, partial [Pocillopora meandrina]
DSNPRFKTLRDLFQHLPLSDIVDAWIEGKESINECANILLNKMKSTSDVQQLQDQYASCLESDIHDGDDDGGDDVDEDKKYSNVNTKINTLIDAGILKEVLLKIASGFHKEEYLRVKVRRKWAWKDFKLSLQRAKELKVHMKVQFVGESAINKGGPRCELFCLVDRMVSNELMQGEDGQKTFLHNMVLLQKNEYHLYRQAVTEYILFRDLNQVHPSGGEVPDYEVRKKLEELEAITNPEIFVQEASFNFPKRFSAGYCKLIVNVEDKEELVRYVAPHYAVSCCQAELDQFIKGLELHRVLNLLRAHPNQAKRVLQGNLKLLIAELINEIFQPVLSTVGDIKRDHEEAILVNFHHFLEVENGLVHYVGEKNDLL